MRRVLSVGFFTALLLSACVPQVEPLPPEEVLRRATLAGQALQSARFSVESTIAVSKSIFGEGGGTVNIDGVLNEGGRQVSSTVEASLSLRDLQGIDRRVRAVAETVTTEAGRFYLRVRELSVTPQGDIFDPKILEALLHSWWYFDPPESDGTPVTPSPRLLQAQASVVRVTRDLGVQTLEDGAAYHYAVALDAEAFLVFLHAIAAERGSTLDEEQAKKELAQLQATGELWVNASSFTVSRVEWEIPSFPLGDGSLLRVEFTATLRDINSAPAISVPTDAQPFPSAEVLLPGSEEESMMPEGMDEEEFRSTIERFSDSAIFPPDE